MTQKEFLTKIHLSAEEFRDLVRKFSDFEKLLGPAQRDALRRSLPSMAKALKSLGPEVTSDELMKVVKKLIGEELLQDDAVGTIGSNIWAANPNPGKHKKKN